MEGAGSLRLANWLYNVAPKDGTVFGTIGRGTGFDPLLGHKTAQFEGPKFSWIGSANDEVSVCVVWNGRSKIAKFDDLLTNELTVGGTGAAADTDQFPRIINGVLGTKMKIITGYPGGNDVNLALERGEVDGRCGWSWSSVMSTRASWIKDKKVTILMQLSLAKHPDLPDVPLITDLAKTEEQRQILRLIFARQALGRPYLGPPDIPADRLEALRKAFMDTMKDKEFLAEAEKAQLEITPVDGAALQKLVSRGLPDPARRGAEGGRAAEVIAGTASAKTSKTVRPPPLTPPHRAARGRRGTRAPRQAPLLSTTLLGLSTPLLPRAKRVVGRGRGWGALPLAQRAQ